jgi:hypothetical protein
MQSLLIAAFQDTKPVCPENASVGEQRLYFAQLGQWSRDVYAAAAAVLLQGETLNVAEVVRELGL